MTLHDIAQIISEYGDACLKDAHSGEDIHADMKAISAALLHPGEVGPVELRRRLELCVHGLGDWDWKCHRHEDLPDADLGDLPED